MLPCSDLPKGYEPGRFHLLPLGIFVELIGMPAFIFTGRIYHGGTAPLAPDGTEDIEPWAYRFVMIFYPASRIITGSTQTYMAASGIRGRGITLPYETFGPKYGHRLLSVYSLTQQIYIVHPAQLVPTRLTTQMAVLSRHLKTISLIVCVCTLFFHTIYFVSCHMRFDGTVKRFTTV